MGSVATGIDYSDYTDEMLEKVRSSTSRSLNNVCSLVDSLQQQIDNARRDEEEWRKRHAEINTERLKRRNNTIESLVSI